MQTKRTILLMKAAVTIVSFAAVVYMLSRSGPQKWDPSALTLNSQEGETIGFDDLVSNNKRGIFFFVGTGLQCMSCVEVFETWERRVSEWPSDKLKVAIVGDGRYLRESHFWAFIRKYEILWAAGYYDPYGSLGRQYRVAGTDQILAVNGGAVTFVLPFSDAFWKRIGEPSDLIDILLWEAAGLD